MSSLLTVRDIECRYGDQVVVDGLTLQVGAGDLVCLLGPSGCGKTTVLRAVAGFEPVFQGAIRLGEREVSRPGFTLPPERRQVGMVFQDYALFPHLTVERNVCFGLSVKDRAERARIAGRALELVGLTGLGHRYPHELSGGQQQRVALARALAPRPSLILLDEPFSNLDVDLRERLSLEVRQILKGQGITAILVTHDQHEAFALADQIGVMHEGTIQQWGTAYDLYHEPANRFVADFVGQGVLLSGVLRGPTRVQTEAGELTGRRAYDLPEGTEVDLLLRPDDLVHDPEGPIHAQVVQKAFRGAETLYTLRLATGTRVLSLFPSHWDFPVGGSVKVRVAAEHLVVFPRA
jgi:iron(III) transport system ATP-binding protein